MIYSRTGKKSILYNDHELFQSLNEWMKLIIFPIIS